VHQQQTETWPPTTEMLSECRLWQCSMFQIAEVSWLWWRTVSVGSTK